MHSLIRHKTTQCDGHTDRKRGHINIVRRTHARTA